MAEDVWWDQGFWRRVDRFLNGEVVVAGELSETQKAAVREAHKNGDTVEALADAYGVSKATIERLVTDSDATKSTQARRR